jgi:hypothetical protein
MSMSIDWNISTPCPYGYFDLQGAITHELGHIYGLGDIDTQKTQFNTNTMWHVGTTPDDFRRTLEPGDKAGALYCTGGTMGGVLPYSQVWSLSNSVTIPSNVYVNNGDSLLVTSNCTVNLNGNDIVALNGGYVGFDKNNTGGKFNPFIAVVKSDGKYKGFYHSLSTALDSLSTGGAGAWIHIGDNYTIAEGTTVSIPANTTIKFSSAKGLSVYGTLNIAGSAACPNLYNLTINHAYYGIYVQNTTDAILKYSVLDSLANHCIYLYSEGPSSGGIDISWAQTDVVPVSGKRAIYNLSAITSCAVYNTYWGPSPIASVLFEDTTKVNYAPFAGSPFNIGASKLAPNEPNPFHVALQYEETGDWNRALEVYRDVIDNGNNMLWKRKRRIYQRHPQPRQPCDDHFLQHQEPVERTPVHLQHQRPESRHAREQPHERGNALGLFRRFEICFRSLFLPVRVRRTEKERQIPFAQVGRAKYT